MYLYQKNSKLLYYLKNILLYLIPGYFYCFRKQNDIERLSPRERDHVLERVNYYNQCNHYFDVGESAEILADLTFRKQSAYYFDLYEVMRYFPRHLRFQRLFGDITHVPEIPSLLKSRPLRGDNTNSVLLKLNKVRHFNFIKDAIPLRAKRNALVWRGNIKPKHHRNEFVKQYHNHPLCNVGYTNPLDHGFDPSWKKDYMPINHQLRYKFVLSLEGNDVASNLKWILSSNSLCFMRQPRYETWFMEGRLIPDYHYVQLRDDFADLEEKIQYYSQNQEAAEAIINNAHHYLEPFKNARRERLISILVLQKYFELSRQLQPQPNSYFLPVEQD